MIHLGIDDGLVMTLLY